MRRNEGWLRLRLVRFLDRPFLGSEEESALHPSGSLSRSEDRLQQVAPDSEPDSMKCKNPLHNKYYETCPECGAHWMMIPELREEFDLVTATYRDLPAVQEDP